MSTHHVEKSRTFPASIESAYDMVLTSPLPEIFSRRYGAIAPIVAVEGQEGEWGTAVGQTRTIRLKDKGTVLETLTLLDRPHAFGYEIGNITGLMKPLVAAATGKWTFDPAGTGVRITWAWDITPNEPIGKFAMSTFTRLWEGYARQAMDEIEKILVP